MPYHIFFGFATGLKETMTVPKGTLAELQRMVAMTEETLELKRKKPRKQYAGDHTTWLCSEHELTKTMRRHQRRRKADTITWRDLEAIVHEMERGITSWNDYTRKFYGLLSACSEPDGWQKPTPYQSHKESEELTPETFKEYIGFLRQRIEWPREFWSREYWMDYLTHIWKVLGGDESRGIELGCEPLSFEQRKAMLWLIEGEQDQWGYDSRAEQPLDENDEPCGDLASSYDGGYDYCDGPGCGRPYHPDYSLRKCNACPQKMKCGLREKFYDEDLNHWDADGKLIGGDE